MAPDASIDLEHRFVVTDGTAPALARALLLDLHRRPAMLGLYVLPFVLATLMSYAWADPPGGLADRVVAAMAYGIVPALAFVGLLMALTYRAARRRVARRFPAGAEVSAGFGHDGFVVRGPAIAQRTPYRAVRSLRVRGRCVILETARPPVPPALLPRELFSDAALDRVRRGMNRRRADASRTDLDPAPAKGAPPHDTSGAPADLDLDHRFVADAGTVRRAVAAFLSGSGALRNLGAWVLAVFVLLFVLNFGSTDGHLAATLILTLPSTGLVALFLVGVVWSRTTRNLRRGMFAGAVLESGFGDDGFMVRGPDGARWVAYSEVASVTPQGRFVLLRQVDDPVTRVVPRALMPDDEVELIRRGGDDA